MESYIFVFGSFIRTGYIANSPELSANSPEISANPQEENEDLERIRSKDLFYSYNPITNEGYSSCGCPINVDTSYSLEKEYAEQIHHPNYLGLRFINHEAKHIVHQQYEQTFKEYVKGISVSEYRFLKVENHPQLIYRWIMPEKLKHIIRNMLQFVCDMHMNGKCLSNFDEDNLVVTQNSHWDFDEDSLKTVQKKSIMFWKVDFVEFTLKGRHKDMKCLHRIIGKLFAQSSTPLEVTHFLGLLIADVNENQWKSMEFYLKHHLAILTIKDRMLFMKNCNEKQNFITNEKINKSYRRALKIFSNSMLDCPWRERFEDNALGPMKLCYNHKAKEDDEKSSTSSTKETTYVDVSWMDPGILRCIQNLSTYLPDYIAFYKQYDTSKGAPFHDNFRMDMELDACMMYLFCEELLKFQSDLYDQNVLEEIHR